MQNLEKLSEDLKNQLLTIATQQDSLVMSFIAPEKLVRKSPIEYDSATMGINDLYNIEKVVSSLEAKSKLPKKLILVIHTPGGLTYAATKITNYLLYSFDEITAFVPYEAASGGTVLCLAAKEIVLDKAANLTPIDPQIVYKGIRISTVSYEQAVDEFEEKYGKLSPAEIPSPHQQMANDFDPIIKKEFKKIVDDGIITAFKFLSKSQGVDLEMDKKKAGDLLNIAIKLVRPLHPHSHIIDFNEAGEMGLPLSEEPDKIKMLDTFKKWVSTRIYEESLEHIIDHVYPEVKQTIEVAEKTEGGVESG